MKIKVFVKTNSKVEAIEKQPDGSLVVRVRVPPTDGKANERIRELLAGHFGVPKSAMELVHGFKSKWKVFELS